VGKFWVVSKTPTFPMKLIDWGLQWHSDGIEITNSGGRSPATEHHGCPKKVGPSTSN
jgi:hypothetical protein